MENFNEKLRRLRIEKRITQKEVAKQLKISETCYAGYEQGYRQPDIDMLAKICIFFNITSDYMIGIENEDGTKTYNNTYNNFGTHQGDVKF